MCEREFSLTLTHLNARGEEGAAVNFGGGGASTLSGRLFAGGASCERIEKHCYTPVSHRGDTLPSLCNAKHLSGGAKAAVERGE